MTPGADNNKVLGRGERLDIPRFLHGIMERTVGCFWRDEVCGQDYDCVSRSFAAKLDVAEDPVCGSGHCHIAPYWSQRIGSTLTAYQASVRGGILYCRVAEGKVFLSGKVALFSIADLMMDIC